MTTPSQLETLRGKIEELEAEILLTKKALAAGQNTTELDFLRKQLLLLQEKENILLRGQVSGGPNLPQQVHDQGIDAVAQSIQNIKKEWRLLWSLPDSRTRKVR